MIRYIIKDWLRVNKSLWIEGKYIAIVIYNLVMVLGFPISVLPALFEYLDRRK